MKLKILFFLITLASGISGIFPTPNHAQVIPDNTLGAESSKINSINELRDYIEGGATRGNNLFHSFQEFNINEGLEIYFANPEGIVNIFSRVTGNNISEILGTLGVEGNANLFFMNPNGIIFGENARLDLGGSFIATTADRVEFADQKSFAVHDEGNQKPILTLNAPIGLGLNGNNGSIEVIGTGNNLVIKGFSLTEGLSKSGLQVANQQTLALIGGKIILSGGSLFKENGTIEFISVKQGNVFLNLEESKDKFDFQKDIELDNILLSNESSIISTGGGNIRLVGKNISLLGSSVILSQNQSSDSAENLTIQASESLEVRDSAPNSGIVSSIRSEAVNQGSGANINIFANNLFVKNGGQIVTQTFSPFNNLIGGNIDINVSKNIELIGTLSDNPNILSLISTSTFGLGNAGNIKILAESIFVGEGANLSSATFLPFFIFSDKPGLFEAAATGKIAKAGNITIEASKLVSLDGFDLDFKGASFLGTASFSPGNAGDLIIDTSRLILENGGRVDSSSFAGGGSGNIRIKADIIELSGIIPKSTDSSTIASSVDIIDETARKRVRNLTDNISSSPIGLSGNIEINANSLKVRNGANIRVNNAGIGNGGNLELNINSIFLDEASITASTISGNGGNITLNSDRIQIENNSNISASAGGEGNGGNVNITADTFLALNDSDVTATAVRGNGGNIRIDAGALLGIQERKATPGNGTSDADASSEFGQDGTVIITNPQSNIQDPTVAIKDPQVNIIEPKFEPDCFEQKERLTDSRHDNIPRNPDTSFDDVPYFPDNNFVPPLKTPQFNPQSLEDLIWREGYPVASGNHLIATPDGKVLLVVESQFESLKRRGCISPEVEVIE